jgi:hypothetical protein
MWTEVIPRYYTYQKQVEIGRDYIGTRLLLSLHWDKKQSSKGTSALTINVVEARCKIKHGMQEHA